MMFIKKDECKTIFKKIEKIQPVSSLTKKTYMLECWTKGIILTDITIQWFSLRAPQHPKKETINTITPIAIRRYGIEKNPPSSTSL